jgi:hypothetical protein
MPAGFIDVTLQGTPALNQIDNQHDDGDDDQNMNQTAANMHCEAKQPKYEQNNEDCPEHKVPFG